MRIGFAGVAAVATMTGCADMFGLGSGKPQQRSLMEFGSIEIPKRLEPRPAAERTPPALFRFERIADSFSAMGSSTPVRELLVVAVGAGPARGMAQDRTEGVVWRSENGFEIGEGVHKVNLMVNPAWVLFRQVPGKPVALAYMAWKKDATLGEAIRVVETAERSLQQAMSLDEYSAVARDRPAREREKRWMAVRAHLDSRGVRLDADGSAAGQDGTLYELTSRFGHDEGRRLTVLHPLGSAQAAKRFRHQRPSPPRNRIWPDIVWSAWEGGEWRTHGIDGDYAIPAGLAGRMAARQADRSRAYFYAIDAELVDDLDSGGESLGNFYATIGAMVAAFAGGKLVLVE